MTDDEWPFYVILAVGGIIGAAIGGWLGHFATLTVLGLVVGGVLGFIGTLLLLIKVYGWAMDDLEEEWRERRKEWEQERNKDDKTGS